MAYPLRPLVPGSIYFVTINCSERRCLLRPDVGTTELIAYWLARAQRLHPQVILYGVVAMSNHLHLLVRDRASELSAFMAYFTGNLAKGINALRDRSGHVFDRRFASEEVLDDEAFIGRLVYLVTNPVKAHLVTKFEDWPGLLFWAQDGYTSEREVQLFDRVKYERDCERAGDGTPQPDRTTYFRHETLYVHAIEPVADCDSESSPEHEARNLLNVVRARESELSHERQAARRTVLGVRKLLEQDWNQAPGPSKRSPRPLCHATSHEIRDRFRQAWKALRQAYADASEAFRGGFFEVEFPPFTCRPYVGLLPPAAQSAAA